MVPVEKGPAPNHHVRPTVVSVWAFAMPAVVCESTLESVVSNVC